MLKTGRRWFLMNLTINVFNDLLRIIGLHPSNSLYELVNKASAAFIIGALVMMFYGLVLFAEAMLDILEQRDKIEEELNEV